MPPAQQSTMTTSTTQAQRLEEKLPDAAPTALFFFPNFIGVALSYLLERFDLEGLLDRHLAFGSSGHPYALLGLGIFALANVNSLLGGNVVNARVQYGVKLPALYANKSEHDKHCTEFNAIQRSHQNFLENYGQLVLSVMCTAVLANRSHTAGMMLLIVSMCRVLYGMQYQKDVDKRIPAFLIIMMTTSIGIGYGFWLFVGLDSLK